MYLKSLTLKGFKSFASATHLRLEPGITAIVGPNGSGKSNVVDALAWVMGEQGAKSLRGGKMEDVIFAGTAGRPPLGRAEVSLTIDNADGALPIDYSEVTITRTMFRSGGSDYSINGTSCRLLDIQELLSDTGIGREMHVIVGQGQLDTVLRATPEERRGFIEEAAGVLKHRRRKERALRKLETMETNLTRVHDLTSEIRRQLGPLARQAETARRAAVIQAEHRDARLRLLADDLAQLTATLEQEVADETALTTRRTDVEAALRAEVERIAELEAQAQAARPVLAASQDLWFRLSQLHDRLVATGTLAAERVRLLEHDDDHDAPADATRDPDRMRASADQLAVELTDLQAQVAEARDALTAATEARAHAEESLATETTRLARLTRAAADRREGLAKLGGQVGAKLSRIEAGEAEIGRLQVASAAAAERAAVAEREFAALESTVAHDEQGEEGLDTAYEKAAADLAAAEQVVEGLLTAERAAEQRRTTATARAEALELSLRRKDGAATLLARADPQHAIIGSIASQMVVSPGHEFAIAAALGWAADALATRSAESAGAALASLRADEGGQAALLVPATARVVRPDDWPALPDGARWGLDLITCDDSLRPALAQVLDRVAVITDRAVHEAVSRIEGVTVVTPDGDVIGPGFARGGSVDVPSRIELQAAVDTARDEVARATTDGERLRFELASARAARDDRAGQVEAALERLHDSDARMAAVAERLGALGVAVRTARAEIERTERAIAIAQAALDNDRAEHESLAERLAAATGEGPVEVEPATGERDRLDAEAVAARAHETETRLTLRTLEERARALGDRVDSLRRSARAEEQARERRIAQRARRRREAEVARAVGRGASYAVGVVSVAVAQAAEEKARGEADRATRDEELVRRRRAAAETQDELRELTDSVHRDEVARAQQRLRIEALQTRAIEELGIDPDELVTDYGPHQPVPMLPDPDGDPDAPVAEPTAYVREVQEKRLRSAERKLSALGRINPLALEEYAALEERHKFLTTQLDDLKKSKRDLLDIVKDVDQRVERAFGEAFHDTAREFERVFERLFPGGEGRITLTDPENLLTTGIEVEARPPGKKIKRLSLLSGGERSLVAVALLVAIFKARPSPFYVMDEVEAALDDANLGRLITLFEELRDSSQLIVITHQKRTMETADALYGVTMRGDGVTTVVSQRIRDVS